jgi:uncharacterized protein (DUF433 family)
MQIVLRAEAPPLRLEESGAIRIGESRVLLELVIRAFQDGLTPEGIAQRYSTLELRDVYSTIAYYLGHMQEIDGFLDEREKRAQDVRNLIETQQGDLSGLRQRLINRRNAK